jgi:hypothetical protein
MTEAAQPAKCCHYDEGYAEGEEVGYAAAFSDHDCAEFCGHTRNQGWSRPCVGCSGMTFRAYWFAGSWVPVCGPCEGRIEATVSGDQICDALRSVLS